MTEIFINDKIEKLNMSTRLHNCLRRIGIDTIEKLLDFPEEEWFRDGVHYTPEGYEELISTIVKAVEDVNSDSDDDSDDSDDDDKESNKSTRGDDDSDDVDDDSDDMDEDDDSDDEDDDEEDDIELHSSGSISEESL